MSRQKTKKGPGLMSLIAAMGIGDGLTTGGVRPRMGNSRPVWLWLCCVVLCSLFALHAASARAQGFDTGLLRQFEELSKQRVGGSMNVPSPLDIVRSGGDEGASSMPQPGGLQDYILREEFLSPLERDYKLRTNEELRQFGYDMFGRQAAAGANIITGRVPDNYIMGVGDQVVVTFQGSTTRSISTAIDREGRLILEGLAPIPAAGRSFGELQQDVQARTRESMIGTEAYVSLGALRMMSVYVLGEVERPGLQRVTSLTTVLEALSMAGGLKKTGSFRDIRIVVDGKTRTFDFYRFLQGQDGQDLRLSEGARIIVPVIGRTAAVAGGVLRPGIYELPPRGSISHKELLALAGGSLRPTGYSFVLNRLSADGRQEVTTIGDLGQAVQDGDVLVAGLREQAQTGRIELVGAVRSPGMRSLTEAPTLRDLLRDSNVFDDYPYLLFGVIETTDPRTRARNFVPFSPEQVIYGKENRRLQDNDKVIILGRNDIRFLSSNDTRRVVLTGQYTPVAPDAQKTGAEGQNPAQAQAQARAGVNGKAGQLNGVNGKPKECRALAELAQIVSDTRSDRYATAIQAVFVQLDVTNAEVERSLAGADQENGLQALNQSAMVMQQPYPQPYPQQVTEAPLSEQQWLFMRRVERLRKAELEEEDDETCPQAYEKVPGLLPFVLEYVVSASGAVRRPGVYPLVEGTTLASLVAAAGGTTYNVDLSNVELGLYRVSAGSNQPLYDRRSVNALEMDLAQVELSPASGIHFKSRFSNQEAGAVLLAGEVRFPGVYTIERGEKLSSLIARAGGLTEEAYPYGAVFTRKRVKEAQELGFKRTAREINSGLATAALKQRQLSPQTLLAAQQLADRIATADVVGRVVIEADPRVLAERPELDTNLEPGDQLHIPKRPNYVLMIGDVLNPGALQFIAGKGVKEYIREAGGVLPTADDDRIFVVYPNGVARPVKLSSWGFASDASMLPPGSSIVVPKDVEPIDTMQLVRDITAILSQLAVSAASIAVISR